MNNAEILLACAMAEDDKTIRMNREKEAVTEQLEEAIKIVGKVEEPTFWLDAVRIALENALRWIKER